MTDLPLSAPLLLPLRRRIYGILLREAEGAGEEATVEEWCIMGLDTDAWQNNVTPVWPAEGKTRIRYFQS